MSETVFLGQKLWLSGCDSSALCQHPEPTDSVWLGKDAIEPGVPKSGIRGPRWTQPDSIIKSASVRNLLFLSSVIFTVELLRYKKKIFLSLLK